MKGCLRVSTIETNKAKFASVASPDDNPLDPTLKRFVAGVAVKTAPPLNGK